MLFPFILPSKQRRQGIGSRRKPAARSPKFGKIEKHMVVCCRPLLALAFLPFILEWNAGAATFMAQGTNLTVASDAIQVSFNGADVVAVTNQLTGESYLRNPSPNRLLNLKLVQASDQTLSASGDWAMSSDGKSAALGFTDSNRTISVTVSVDPATQEIIVDLDGHANQGGVEGLVWGITGYDLTAGKFILPAQGGMSITSASLGAHGQYSFSDGFYGGAWEAPLSLFQSNQGGVAVYSTDTHSLSKDLTVLPSLQQTANELFQVEAPGPWNAANEAGPIEWRLAAYQGNWQAGARIYRDWHNTVAPPVALTDGRAWASNVRTVIQTYPPYNTAVLDSLASALVPSETLLYLVYWRANAYDAGYPDYSWDSSIPAFISYAHKLGFHVMLHTDALGVSPSSPDFAAVQQFQIKDPLTLQPLGWFWNLPASTPNRFAAIDPAASVFRQLFLARLTPALQTLQPDAIHLDFTTTNNDGNGLIEGMNYNQGLAQLHRDLLAAFPNLVLGAEETNDMIAPYENFSQPLAPVLDPNVTPPVPVSAYVLPNVSRYWHLSLPENPDEPGFLAELAQYEGQAVLPTLHTQLPALTQTDMARWMKTVSAFQQYSLAPAWDTDWNGALVSYQGTNGAQATLTDDGSIVEFALQQQDSSTTLYQHLHASNQIDSSLSVPRWPAYNGTLTLGLDPGYEYWLDTTAANPALPYINGLPPGARLGLGAGTLVTPQFSYFQVLPPAAASFDFFANLWRANVGVTFNAADFPLANGASVGLATMIVGGVSQQAIFTSPPYMAQRGGETFLEYTVPVAAGNSATLSFAAGILDSAIGNRQSPMTFKVEVNGAILWQQDVSTGAWQAGSVDMSPFMGQTVAVRFVTNPGPTGNPDVGWGGWSALQLSVAADDRLSRITLALSPAITAAQVSATGGSISVDSGTATVDGLPKGGTILILNGQPATAASGQSLLNLPFTLSQSSTGQLAGPPVDLSGGTGKIGAATSGGVTKQPTLNASAPPNGQTICSWLLQLPAAALSMSFSAAYLDGFTPSQQGYLMAVRVNGTTLWQYNVNLTAGWVYGTVDLSAWAGQTILLELITDSQGPNYSPATSWAELNFGDTGGANRVTSRRPAAGFSP